MNSTQSEYLNGDCSINYLDHQIENHRVLEHSHPNFEIAFFIKADIRIFIKSRQYDIRDGDLIFINKQEIHKMIYSPQSHYARYVINFRQDFIGDMLKHLQIMDLLSDMSLLGCKKFTLTLMQRSKYEAMIKALFDFQREYSFNKKIQAAKLKLGIIQLILSIHELPIDRLDKNGLSQTEKIIEQIISFIDAHYRFNLTLDLLEQEFHLSKYYISRIFRRITGFSVVSYIQNRRVIEAQKMLKNTSESMISICHDCGFNNIQHFCRVFKKLSHYTPREFRNSKLS